MTVLAIFIEKMGQMRNQLQLSVTYQMQSYQGFESMVTEVTDKITFFIFYI